MLCLGQLYFHFKEQGVTLLALVFSAAVPRLRLQSSTNPLHVNSVSADTCVAIANLIGGCIPNIFRDKSVEKTQTCDEELSRGRKMENKLCITKVKNIQESC